MQAESNRKIGERRARYEWQWTAKGNRPLLAFAASMPLDFGIRIAAAEPVASEKPVGERRQDTCADNRDNEPRPVHQISLSSMSGSVNKPVARAVRR